MLDNKAQVTTQMTNPILHFFLMQKIKIKNNNQRNYGCIDIKKKKKKKLKKQNTKKN
jgi:hypothetical protein